MAEKIDQKIIGWIIAFIFTFYLSQILENFIASQPDFIFKSLIQLVIPGPEDSIIELMQFLLYWAGGAYFAFKE